ncbi:MAG: diaminopropionate ammonia-lyase [Candidatus Zixiibacteriota bacterium]
MFEQESVSDFVRDDIQPLHRSIPGYAPTPLLDLPARARQLGVKRLLVKDESQRFGLRAFKALGATYAVYRFVCEECRRAGRTVPPPDTFYTDPVPDIGPYTFCTATDGNHGRGVAWVARVLGQRAVIFMPHGSEIARVEAIEREGADVIIVDGDYDAAVRAAAQAAADNGWNIISDTSWPGYTEIPRWIAAGYLTMFREIETQSDAQPDVVFVQGGVGALASAAGWFYRQRESDAQPILVSVEADAAACLLESAQTRDGAPVTAQGDGRTIMAGLNCGTPSAVAWPIVRRTFDAFVAIGDDECRAAMTMFRQPIGDDPPIDTGESGAAGLAALHAIIRQNTLAPLRESLPINAGSTILVLNTEGDTAAHSETHV